MFTKANLKALVPLKIFERGKSYYEGEAVGRIRRTGDTFKAKVEGTETYRVELTIRAGKPPKIYCDCPYNYGDVCKHGIALGLAVLEWFGSAAPEPAPAPPEVLTKKDRRARLLTAAWARTSDRERLEFLRQLLLQKPRQLHRFLDAFEFDEAALLAAGRTEPPSSFKPKPKPQPEPEPKPQPQLARRVPLPLPPPPRRLPPPSRPPTFLAQAHRLIQGQKPQELLPLLLATDWLRESAGNNPTDWAAVLAASAQAQPEATLDAVMERLEGYLEDPALRGSQLYHFVVTCLRALVAVPALAPQVRLFASELLNQYRRLTSLRQALKAAGFLPIENELETGLPPKKRGRSSKAPVR